MRLFTLGCLLVCTFVRSSKIESGSIPSDVKDGYFRGRSGPLILQPTQSQSLDVAALFLDKSGQLFDSSQSSLSAYDFADFVGSAVGLQPLSSHHQAAGASQMFVKAPANVYMAIESLGSETASKLDLANLNPVSASQKQWLGSSGSLTKKTINYPAYPSSSLSISASLLSGVAPSAHGIVARQWQSKTDGRTIDALDENGSTQTATLGDVLGQTFGGQSLLVSVSSDWQHARLQSLNPALTSLLPSALTITFDSMQGWQGQGVSSLSELVSQSKTQLLSHLSGSNSFSNALSGGVATSFKHNDIVAVQFPGSWGHGHDVANFDLQSPVDYKLMAELQYAFELPDRLASHAVLTDNAPDLYFLTFTSVTGLVEKYGRDSQEVRGALHLFDAAIPAIMGKFISLYANHSERSAVGEVVLLGSHPSSLQTADTRDLQEHITRIMPKQGAIKKFFPSLYLQDAQAARMCQSESEVLALAVQPYGFSVYCPWLSLATRPTASLLSLDAPHLLNSYVLLAASNISNSTVTASQVQNYQIVLWISLIMSFAVYWATYAIGFMSFKKDTLLYSTFNPGWEDRKRR